MTETQLSMNRRVFIGGFVFSLLMALRASGDMDSAPEQYSSASYPHSLLVEDSDMRRDFYESGYDGVEKYKKNGMFLMIGQLYTDTKGFSFSHAIGISTNACPTVGSALAKYDSAGIGESRQIRLIQLNAILQTPPSTCPAAKRGRPFWRRGCKPATFLY